MNPADNDANQEDVVDNRALESDKPTGSSFVSRENSSSNPMMQGSAPSSNVGGERPSVGIDSLNVNAGEF